jgi:hypothetical protein
LKAGGRSALSASIRARRRVRIDALRAAARDRVERTGLRAVAREIGMSAPSLAQFLEGSCPREATLRKIRDWYFSEAAARAGDVSPETARTAVGMLVDGVPEPRRGALVREVLSSLADAHQRHGAVLPGWLTTLWDETGEPHDEDRRADGEDRRADGAASRGAGGCGVADRRAADAALP